MGFAVRTVLSVTVATIISQPLRADNAAKAQKLIDRAIMAMGGNEALEKSRNRIIEDSGTYYGMGDGVPYKGRYVYRLESAGRYRIEIFGAFVQVTDRDTAWASTQGNTTDLQGEVLDVAIQEMFRSYVLSLIPLQKPSDAFKLSMIDPETVDGEECDGINVEHEKLPTITIHFSRQSGLIKRTKYVKKAAELKFAEVVEETVFHNYKENDGLNGPMSLTVLRDGKKFVESQRQNVTYPDTIDEREFKKPE